MGAAPPQFKFKQSQVFTWELEPSDERPSEFANSAFRSSYGRSGEFAGSAFLEPARAARDRQRKRQRRRLLRLTLAALCILLTTAAIVLLSRVFL